MAAGHGRGHAARQPPPVVAGPEQLQFGQMEPVSGPYQAQVPLSLEAAAAKGLEDYMQTGYMPAQVRESGMAVRSCLHRARASIRSSASQKCMPAAAAAIPSASAGPAAGILLPRPAACFCGFCLGRSTPSVPTGPQHCHAAAVCPCATAACAPGLGGTSSPTPMAQSAAHASACDILRILCLSPPCPLSNGSLSSGPSTAEPGTPADLAAVKSAGRRKQGLQERCPGCRSQAHRGRLMMQGMGPHQLSRRLAVPRSLSALRHRPWQQGPCQTERRRQCQRPHSIHSLRHPARRVRKDLPQNLCQRRSRRGAQLGAGLAQVCCQPPLAEFCCLQKGRSFHELLLLASAKACELMSSSIQGQQHAIVPSCSPERHFCCPRHHLFDVRYHARSISFTSAGTLSQSRSSATGQPNHSSMSSAERSYSSASSQEPEARQSHLPQPDHRPAKTPGAQAAATAAPAHQPVADTALADGRQPSKEPQTQPEDALTDAPATPEAQAEPARSQARQPASEASAAHRVAEEAGPCEEAAAVKPAAAWGTAPGGSAWGQKKSFAQILAADAGGRALLAAPRKGPPSRPLAQVGCSEHCGRTHSTVSNERGSPAGSGADES